MNNTKKLKKFKWLCPIHKIRKIINYEYVINYNKFETLEILK